MSASVAIELVNVTKRFGKVLVLPSVSIQVSEGEFFSMLGPSGCGKTTSLRIMAGLEQPDEGRVLLRGRDVTFVPPNKRNVHLVFQNYELFPHMNVFENVAYSLKLKGVPRAEIADRVAQMLALVGVAGLEKRGVRQLSGGQQQRIALARALINRPAALLLDEPLSALDVKLRKRMQFELKAIQAELGTTFVYVTHDQEEALLMSDRIAVMHQGIVRQVGAPQELYRNPKDAFVADFVGSMNVLPFEVTGIEDGVAMMRVPGGRLAMRAWDGCDVGSSIHLAIRPERVLLVPEHAGSSLTKTQPVLRGRITEASYLGTMIRYRLETEVGELTAVRLDDPAANPPLHASVLLTWDVDAPFELQLD